MSIPFTQRGFTPHRRNKWARKLWPLGVVAFLNVLMLRYFPVLVDRPRVLLLVDMVLTVVIVVVVAWVSRWQRVRRITQEEWIRAQRAAVLRGDVPPEKPLTARALFVRWAWRRRRELSPVWVMIVLFPVRLWAAVFPPVVVVGVTLTVFVGLLVWFFMVAAVRRHGVIAAALGLVVWLALPWPPRVAGLLAVAGTAVAAVVRWRYFANLAEVEGQDDEVAEELPPKVEDVWQDTLGAENGPLPGSVMYDVEAIFPVVDAGDLVTVEVE